MERFKPSIRNRKGEVTFAGAQIHELVRIDHVLKNHIDPKVEFAMSEGLVDQYVAKRHQLMQELHMPQRRKARLTRLQAMREALEQADLPFWKIN